MDGICSPMSTGCLGAKAMAPEARSVGSCNEDSVLFSDREKSSKGLGITGDRAKSTARPQRTDPPRRPLTKFWIGTLNN
jgi:hypothetical protein